MCNKNLKYFKPKWIWALNWSAVQAWQGLLRIIAAVIQQGSEDGPLFFAFNVDKSRKKSQQIPVVSVLFNAEMM